MTRRTFLGGAVTLAAGMSGISPAFAEDGTALAAPLQAPWIWSVNLRASAMAADPAGFVPYLDLARRLGVGMVRFDASWDVIEPEAGHRAGSSLAWFTQLVEGAARRGLRVMVNLDDYPHWALRDLASRPDRFYAAWQSHVRRVALAFGPHVAFYQLGNEFNSVLDPIPANLDAPVIAAARQALNDVWHDHPSWLARTVINPFYGFDGVGSDWDGALDQVLSAAADAVDVLALDYYPGSYDPFGNPRDWSPLGSLAHYAQIYDKRLAVGETGCPTWLLGQQRQASWLVSSIPALATYVRDHGLTERMAFVNLFELVDRQSLQLWEFWRPTEATLGLADDRLRPKRGFYTLHSLIVGGGPPPYAAGLAR